MSSDLTIELGSSSDGWANTQTTYSQTHPQFDQG